ncbi:hypothetical protein KJ966_08950 [bacterium]|nr:hypothetical protein [bacterium]
MKNLIIGLIFLFALSGCHQNLSAVNLKPEISKTSSQTMTNDKTEVNSEAVDTDGFLKGDSFSSQKETYVFLPELYSVSGEKRSDSGENTVLNSVHQSRSASFIKNKGNFSIYKSTVTRQSSLSTQTIDSARLYPVVLNPRTGQLAIVTGTIPIKLNNMEDADYIASEYGLTIIRKYAHLNTTFYSTTPGQDMIQVQDSLKSDARVSEVSIEVLETFNTAH